MTDELVNKNITCSYCYHEDYLEEEISKLKRYGPYRYKNDFKMKEDDTGIYVKFKDVLKILKEE